MNEYQRAAQFWSVLVLAARTQQVLSYEMMEQMTGIPQVGVGRILSPIQDYCKRWDLPPLTAIVITKETGLPGGGFTAATDILSAQARVFVFDWLERGAPSAEDFEASSHKHKGSTA